VHKTYISSLRQGLEELLNEEDCYLIGEDIAETYGGAFKVSEGLAVKFPGKVLNMPMSEQAFTGMGIGMALAGMRPIIEIMFGDFVTLIMDQMLNHASKIVGGFGKPLHMVVRVPMGGYRGYGATHSQSLEKLYLGLPYINLIIPSVLADPGELLVKSMALGEPVLFIENKLDYTRKMFFSEEKSEVFSLKSHGSIPMQELALKGEEEQYIILTYGGFVSSSIDLIHDIFIEEEIAGKLIAVTCFNKIDFSFLNKIIEDKKLYILEEGHSPFGVGDNLLANLYKASFRGEATVIGAEMENIGASKKMEDHVLPNFQNIKSTIIKNFN
jgi:acetoin:2,6-dichlorophenolindophenol oxidoreductase subunit beta